MTDKTIGFIGGGRITRIFLDGWKSHGALPARIVVNDCNSEALCKLKSRFPSIETAPANTAASCDVVFVALHPPVMTEVLVSIKGSLNPNALLVSLAPKFTFAKLTELLGGFTRLARVIPNAPSLIGQGFNPLAFAPAISSESKHELLALLKPIGECPEVAEEKLEAYAVLSAMGPTYLWFQLQTLREMAAGFGLTDAEIAPAMKRMVCGGTRTLLESGLTPAEVMDLIPVKPLADIEAQVIETYRTRLSGVYQKIKP